LILVFGENGGRDCDGGGNETRWNLSGVSGASRQKFLALLFIILHAQTRLEFGKNLTYFSSSFI
jgi:hypothetical protein